MNSSPSNMMGVSLVYNNNGFPFVNSSMLCAKASMLLQVCIFFLYFRGVADMHFLMWYAFADWCGIQTAYNQSVEKFFWVGARKRNKTIVVEEYVVSSSMDYLKHKK